MSSPNRTASASTKINVVMVVSDACDGEVQCCVERLRQADVRVEVIPDVYAATARLAQGAPVAQVLVDARTLDDKELAFLRLVPRFFPRCEVVVPAFPGLQDRAVFHVPGVRMGPAAGVIEALIGDHVQGLGLGRMESPLAVHDAEQPSPRMEPGLGTPPVSTAQEQWHTAETEADAAGEAEETWESAPAADEALEEGPRTIQASPEVASGSKVEPESGTPPASTAQEQWHTEEQSHTASETGQQAGSPLLEASPRAEPPGPESGVPRLSTDGGPEAAGSGASMHEVVRRRMAADRDRATRRTPPRSPPEGAKARTPATSEPSDAERGDAGPVEPMLSPEELDALLADRDDQGEAGPPWTGTKGLP